MKKTIRLFTLTLGFAVLILGFQNCAQESLNYQDSLYNDNLSYFNYDYKPNTPFYFDLKVIEQEKQGNDRIFQLVGIISKSNPSDMSTLTWEIKIIDDIGNHPPTTVGSSSVDGSLVKIDEIVGKVGRKYVELDILIRHGGKEYQHKIPLHNL